MLQLPKFLPNLLRRGGALGTAPVREFAASAAAGPAPVKPAAEDDDDETFELLPPGCSLKDPSYGRNSLSDPVLVYDSKPVEEYRPLKKRKAVPKPPLNVEAAQAKLQETKDAKQLRKDDDDDFYVYLPPGSSMRDPLPNSLSDPLENRKVYYRDPNPTLRKS